MLEVEAYRRLASRVVGLDVVAVAAPDPWFLKGGLDALTVTDALVGRRLTDARRIGKLLVIDTDGPTLGLRFGMTGVLDVDGVDGVERLEYGGSRREPAWDRFTLVFEGDRALKVRDARRLGGVELDPDEARLGIDAAALTPAGLRAVLGTSQAPLKARLMDQARVAGLGNLLTDEALWRAGLDPARPAGSLSPAEQRRLLTHIRRTLDELGERGGSHTGDLQASRRRGGVCPRDGAELERRTVGGRTTYSCPHHQH
nr:DNA-formamidopyrimidine glycosylase family protein [Rhabdothermincola salaria]